MFKLYFKIHFYFLIGFLILVVSGCHDKPVVNHTLSASNKRFVEAVQEVEHNDVFKLKVIIESFNPDSYDTIGVLLKDYYTTLCKYYAMVSPEIIADLMDIYIQLKKYKLNEQLVYLDFLFLEYSKHNDKYHEKAKIIDNLPKVIFDDEFKNARDAIYFNFTLNKDGLDSRSRHEETSYIINQSIARNDFSFYTSSLFYVNVYYQDLLKDSSNVSMKLDSFLRLNKKMGYIDSYIDLTLRGVYLDKIIDKEESLKELVSLAKRSGHTNRLQTIYKTLAHVYFENGEYENAIDNYKESLVYEAQRGNTLRYALCEIYINWANILKKNFVDIESDLDGLDENIKTMRELNSLMGIYVAYQRKKWTYEGMGDTSRLALVNERLKELELTADYQTGEIYDHYASSLFNSKVHKNEIAELKSSNEAYDNRLSLYRVIMLAALLTVLLLLILLYVNLQKVKLANEIEEKNTIIESQNLRLKDLIGELQETNTNLDAFAHITAHDLKSPLLSILGFANLLKNKVADKLKANEKVYFDYIIDDCNSLSTAVDTMLQFSTLVKDLPPPEAVNVNDIIFDVNHKLHAIIQSKFVAVKVLHELPSVLANPQLITLIFQNLIHNSIKYSNEIDPPVVEIGYSNIFDGYHQYYVKDNGIGIKSEQLNDVFEPFTKLNDNTKYDGTGVGLSICSKIIAKYGGEISIESEFGKWTAVKFTLPVVDA